MNNSGMSGNANIPEKDAKGKLKNNKNVIKLFVASL
jgi:hypothetical protein